MLVSMTNGILEKTIAINGNDAVSLFKNLIRMELLEIESKTGILFSLILGK
jgi:hypothetical protein